MGNRRNNKMDMTITEQLEAVKSTFCWEYCKFNSEDNEKELEEKHCRNCPLKEI